MHSSAATASVSFSFPWLRSRRPGSDGGGGNSAHRPIRSKVAAADGESDGDAAGKERERENS